MNQSILPSRSAQWLRYARNIWLVFAGLLILLFVVGIPLRYQELATVEWDAAIGVGQLRPQDAGALHQAGFTVWQYGLYFTLAEVVTSLVFFSVGLFLFWRLPTEWIALYVATMLVFVPSVLPTVTVVERAGLISPFIVQVLQISFGFCLGAFLYIFPDGRVIPRAARMVIVLLLIYEPAALLFPALMPPTTFGGGVSPDKYFVLGWTFLVFTLGLAAQIFRYARVSTRQQRQQTKWVVFGIALFMVMAALGVLFSVASSVRDADSFNGLARFIAPTCLLAGLLAIPLSLGFSILRYRLYDIDVLIRRTVTYTMLAVLLLMIYFGSVILLQQLFASVTGQRSEVITVLSTLAIAALFVPLRNRIQDAIDRRFNRQRYDAQRVLQQFATTVRDETDLDELAGSLIDVVNETMQPKSVSMWLKPTADGRPPTADYQ